MALGAAGAYVSESLPPTTDALTRSERFPYSHCDFDDADGNYGSGFRPSPFMALHPLEADVRYCRLLKSITDLDPPGTLIL
jgi:hypothetical protein